MTARRCPLTECRHASAVGRGGAAALGQGRTLRGLYCRDVGERAVDEGGSLPMAGYLVPVLPVRHLGPYQRDKPAPRLPRRHNAAVAGTIARTRGRGGGGRRRGNGGRGGGV